MIAITKPSNMQRVAEAISDRKDAPAVKPNSRDHLAAEAAGFAQVMAFNLLAMRCPTIDQQRRLEASERAFQVWAALCRRMADLEATCPSTAATGYAQAQRLRDFADGTTERPAKPRETIMNSSISGVKA